MEYFRFEAVFLHLGEDIVRGHYVTVRGARWLECGDAMYVEKETRGYYEVPGAPPLCMFCNAL